MNSFSAIDPAKNLASVTIRIFQVFSVILICLSGYMVYLAYLELMIDWNLSFHFFFLDYSPEENSKNWHMFFFAIPGILSLIGFFILGYLGRVIRKE
ncbi:hypothetical protein [Algoriphagus pacificus]|uniref:Uncharacterized protein n=1 Tax=Algoriphagus pacificus TaxID=2811234 RepID=A0ABS3CEI0_9BACT|nr:hypothetical protein [Algoriphagus pacificus]MBN7814919.1 hypothetical protein [Algoriphagus pacificus]